jgi:hypothetical protein
VLKPKHSYNPFLRAILVGFCPVFFAVQLFFNFGISLNSYAQSRYLLNKAVAQARHKTSHHPESSHHQAGFRLNKHFQPESLPGYDLIIVERPVEYISCLNQAFYSIHFIASPFPEAQFLRGPPRINDFA